MHIAGPVDDAFLRVDRAEEHLADIKRRIQAYLESDPEAFIVRVVGKRVFEPTFPEEPPPRAISVIIGESIQNLRTALDYLIFALAWFDSGPDPERKTQFPIEDCPKVFRRKRRRTYLRGVSDDHVAAIESLQPYDGPNWLSQLQALSNHDKHNALALAASVSGSRQLPVGLSDETAIAAGGFRKPGDNVGMYYKFPADVTFKNGPPVVQLLELLISETRALLVVFEPEFEGWQAKVSAPSRTSRLAVTGPLPMPPDGQDAPSA